MTTSHASGAAGAHPDARRARRPAPGRCTRRCRPRPRRSAAGLAGGDHQQRLDLVGVCAGDAARCVNCHDARAERTLGDRPASRPACRARPLITARTCARGRPAGAPGRGRRGRRGGVVVGGGAGRWSAVDGGIGRGVGRAAAVGYPPVGRRRGPRGATAARAGRRSRPARGGGGGQRLRRRAAAARAAPGTPAIGSEPRGVRGGTRAHGRARRSSIGAQASAMRCPAAVSVSSASLSRTAARAGSRCRTWRT